MVLGDSLFPLSVPAAQKIIWSVHHGSVEHLTLSMLPSNHKDFLGHHFCALISRVLLTGRYICRFVCHLSSLISTEEPSGGATRLNLGIHKDGSRAGASACSCISFLSTSLCMKNLGQLRRDRVVLACAICIGPLETCLCRILDVSRLKKEA